MHTVYSCPRDSLPLNLILNSKHFLVNMIKSMLGTDGAFINHSLQVTADADLFQAGVPEMVI